ncbi:MAG: large subunit ribosomal protein L19 [Flavobacteriales bacterium]
MHRFKKKRTEKSNIMDAIKYVQDQMNVGNEKLPQFRAGDTVSVSYKIKEGDKERIQIYRGDVIQIKGEAGNKTFTVRKISNGVGVERVFPLFSPNIDGIQVTKFGKVRRSRLYYLRELTGKKARIKEKQRRQ